MLGAMCRLAKVSNLLVLTLCAAAQAAPKAGAPARPGVNVGSGEQVQTINIVSWDANDLPRVFERSEQLPLTTEEVLKLSEARFSPTQLVRMLEERRCACDASADGLIALKKRGVAPEVLDAISIQALPPNRALTLQVTIDLAGAVAPASEKAANPAKEQAPRSSFFYLFVDDGAYTRVFTADLAELLARRFTHETLVDKSDLLLNKQSRRIALAGALPLKNYGKHEVTVVASARPGLTRPEQLNAQEKLQAKHYTFDYPRSSLQSLCRLEAAYKRDVMLAHRYHYVGANFECEWD